MTLTQKQKRSVEAAPVNMRNKLRANFQKQNGNQNVPRNRRGRGRAPFVSYRNLGRNRGQTFNQFQNRRGLMAQNRFNSVSNEFRTSTLTAPIGVGFNFENLQRTNISLSRVGFIHQLQSSANYTISTLNIHPGNLPWVKTLSTLWDKYMFTSFAMRYMGQTSSTTPGSAFIAFDYDPHTDPATSLWSAQSYDKFVMCPSWSASSWISVPKNIMTDKWYDCELNQGAGQADSWHDKFPAKMMFGFIGGSDAATVGQIEVRFTIQFSRPSAVGEVPPAATTYVFNDKGEEVSVFGHNIKNLVKEVDDTYLPLREDYVDLQDSV